MRIATLIAHHKIPILLLRGGIVVGELYHDNEVVFGPGLVKAHELESKIAVYPRIIMGQSDFEDSILSCSQVSQSVLRNFFTPNCDGFLTLDCFHYANQHTLELCRCKLKQMNSSDLRVQQKINWMVNVMDTRLKDLPFEFQE